MKNILRCMLLAASAFLLANEALAQACTTPGTASNCPAPAGPVILNLDGTPITSYTYTLYSQSFTATDASTNLSFAFREDPSFLFLSNVSLVDTTTSSGNLLLNGDFNLGPVGLNEPTDWTYLNSFGATFAGVVRADCGIGGVGSNCYYDGAVQAYDAITQNVATTPGDLYTVSFYLRDDSGGDIFRALSTNGDVTDTGGNGINLVVYAGGVPVNAVPEPESYAMMLVGIGLLGFMARRRKQKEAA